MQGVHGARHVQGLHDACLVIISTGERGAAGLMSLANSMRGNGVIQSVQVASCCAFKTRRVKGDARLRTAKAPGSMVR